MEQQFKEWLIKRGYSEIGAAISYSRAITKISEHYSMNSGIMNFNVFRLVKN